MSETNPYQPPSSVVDDPVRARTDEVELAGRWQRLGAVLLDTLIGLVYVLPLMWALGHFDFIPLSRLTPYTVKITVALLGFVLFVLVHGYFLKRYGQTIGKKMLGIRIADMGDGIAPFGKIVLLRYLPMSAVPQLPIVGAVLSLMDTLFIFRSDRRCLHDLVAGTRVVKVRR